MEFGFASVFNSYIAPSYEIKMIYKMLINVCRPHKQINMFYSVDMVNNMNDQWKCPVGDGHKANYLVESDVF